MSLPFTEYDFRPLADICCPFLYLVTAYLGLPIYACLYFGHKFWHKTRVIKPEEVDLISGRKEFDLDEAAWDEEEAAQGKLPWWKKLWEGA